MKLETFYYLSKSGWSVEKFPALDSEQTLLLVFGDSHFIEHPEAIAELVKAYPHSKMVGCSTSGEIFDTTVRDDSLSVAVIQFEKTTIMTASAPIKSAAESFWAGEEIAKSLFSPSLRGVLVLSDGIHVNGSELVRGLNSIFPETVTVTGGLAGDGSRFERTWNIDNNIPQTNLIVGVGFYGDHIKLGHGSKGGWDIFGPERRVTRSEGNVLFELDNRPALELYKNYLGDLASELPGAALRFPLALREDLVDEKQIVRTILAIDEATQSLTFAGDIPEGFYAQLMKANFDRLIDGASEAALMSRNTAVDPDNILSIAISCVGRRLVLGEFTEEELEATLDVLPKGTRQIGFYSYGEISPYASGHCDLHNQTMTLTTLSEVL